MRKTRRTMIFSALIDDEHALCLQHAVFRQHKLQHMLSMRILRHQKVWQQEFLSMKTLA